MPATTPPKSRRLLAVGDCLLVEGEVGSELLSAAPACVMGPNRSEFTAQTGRAPMVKMSRTMPPTPVAAPWNGSTALGMVVRLDLERDAPSRRRCQ